MKEALVRVLVLTALCSIGSCAPDAQEEAGSPGRQVSAETEFDWTSLYDVTLRSVKMHPGGFGPEGPVHVHQYLTFFSNGQFDWQRADFSSRWKYELSGRRFFGRDGNAQNQGFVDPDGRRLFWAGIEFEIPQTK